MRKKTQIDFEVKLFKELIDINTNHSKSDSKNNDKIKITKLYHFDYPQRYNTQIFVVFLTEINKNSTIK